MSTNLKKFAGPALVIVASAAVAACNASSGEGEDSHYEFDSDPSGLETNATNAGAAQAEGAGEQIMPGADVTSAALVGRLAPPVDLTNRIHPGLAAITPDVPIEQDGSGTSSIEVGTRIDGNISYSVNQEDQ